MAGSDQYAIGSTAVLIAAAPAAIVPGPVGWFSVANGSGGSVWIGGPDVGSGNGYSIAASGTFSAFLFPGDAVYLVQNSAASTASVFQTGA
jgi:hypothetical protein